MQPAILGTARLGNFRLGYRPAALTALRRTRARITIGGVRSGLGAATRVRLAGLSIHDARDEAPNMCQGTLQGVKPLPGTDLKITINSDAPRVLFAGTFQMVDETVEGWPHTLVYAFTAVDDTARVNRKRPFGTWTNVSATTIAQYLIAVFAPGFTSGHVAAGLPLVSIIFDGRDTFAGCWQQLATLIGGYGYFENLDGYLYQTDLTDAPDALDSTPGRILDDPPIAISLDDSQLITRQYGKGHGEALLTDVDAGETTLPLADVVMNNPGGGQVIAGTTPDGAQSQILNYSGVQLGGRGSLVGPSVAPSVAPSLALAAGLGLGLGVYRYAFTFVTAGSNESLPSALADITTGAFPAPATPMSRSGAPADPSGALDFNSMYTWAYTYVTASGETELSPPCVFGATTGHREDLTGITTGPSGTIARNVYRSVGTPGSSPTPDPNLFLLTTIADNVTTTYGDVKADFALGAAAPSASTLDGQQVIVSGVAIGPSGTTARNIYRTVVDGSQLKLQQTITNNSATVGVTDATSDGALGANAPVTDTSGLTTVSGQINAGSTELLTSGWPFDAAGWVMIGQQVIRHSGLSGNSLTGIPPTGPGAIVSTVKYGEHVDVAPALTGVTGLTLAMLKGAAVCLWVQRDDLAAQAALIALDALQGRVSDGVVEGPPIVDERRGEPSLIALCDATLLKFSRPLATVKYACLDVKTKAGKPIAIDRTAPLINQTLTIQDVTITEIDQSPGTPPRFSATASNNRFSLEAILRKLITAQAGA